MKKEEELVLLLNEKKMKISTAESCTGGLIAATIINVSGASNVYDEGYITYANESKMKLLGVKSETLDNFGAVSYETAYEMACGTKNQSNSDCAIVSTGIAGPLGGTKEKPVGTVFIGVSIKEDTYVKECHFDGDRLMIRQKAVEEAISITVERLKMLN